MKPDITEIEYESLEEAIAAARELVGSNGSVSVHAEGCELGVDESRPCTCMPLELTFGATS